MQTGGWRLSLLGAPQLRTPEGRPVRCEGKQLAVLTLLALEGRVTRARLADLLWPGVGESTGRNNLVILLRRWRQSLGEDLWQGGDRLALISDVEVDVHALLERQGDADDALYQTGPLLDGQEWPELPDFTEWLLAWRERLDALRARQAVEAAGRHETAARYDPALVAARCALVWNPVSEEAHRAVMRAAYLSGDRDAALRAYQDCRAVLHDRLKVEPLPVTQTLAALIERGGTLPATPELPAVSRPALRSEVLVGREREWALMEGAWKAGQAIILVGEAGAGKSRLAADFVASKGEALWFSGRPGDTTVPYATAVRNLRLVLARTGPGALTVEQRSSLVRVLPELRTTPDDGADDTADAQDSDVLLRHSVMAVLAVGLVGRSAVIVDDIHYSDDASIEIFTQLSASAFALGRPGGLPVIVVCYRGDELAPRHVAALAQLLDAGHAAQIEVGPLGETEVQAMLDGLNLPANGQVGAGVSRLSGGNPMLVLEAARYLQDVATGGAQPGLPLRLEQLMTQRLERLSASALPVARAASVLQRDFTAEQIAAMLGRPLLETAAAWEELEQAEIVVGERFSHDLVAEALLTHMPAVVRRLLHRAAARTLGEGGADPARVAQQWLDGGVELEAVPWLLRAVTAAQRAFRHREAVDFAGRTAELLERAGRPQEAFAAWIRRAHLLADLEDQGAEQAQAVQDLYRTAASPAQRAQAHLQEARLLFRTGDTPGMLRVSELGLALARTQPDRHLEAELQEAVAIALLMSRRPAETQQAWTRLLELGTGLHDGRLQASAHEGLGYMLSFVHPAGARPHYEQAEQGFVTAGDPVRAASSAHKAALLAYQHGEVEAALDTLLRAEGYVQRLDGHHVIRLLLADGLSQLWRAQEQFGRALEVLNRAERDHQTPGTSRLGALGMQRALVLLQLGDPEQARAVLEPLMASTTFPSNLWPQRHLAWAEVLAALGRVDEAQAACEETLRLLATHDEPFQRVRLALVRATLAPLDDRAPLLQAALALCEQHGYRGLEAAVRLRLCSLALALGQPVPPLPDSLPDASLVGHAELWQLRLASLRREGATSRALLDMQAAARRWLADTVQQVPEPFRMSFEQAAGPGTLDQTPS